MDVNVKGTLLCVRAVSAQMKQQEARHFSLRKSTPARSCGRGVIINLGSSNSYVATPNIVQYTASKHAVMGITRNAGASHAQFFLSSSFRKLTVRKLNPALDLAPYGIRVNSICPSWVETPMIERAVAGDPNLAFVMSRVVPMGRIATKEEVSDVLMFMSSPRASFVTGAGWMVDGGATLQLQT